MYFCLYFIFLVFITKRNFVYNIKKLQKRFEFSNKSECLFEHMIFLIEEADTFCIINLLFIIGLKY